MNRLPVTLRFSCSTLALIAASSFVTFGAQAQSASTDSSAIPIEQVVVTGTSIRGMAPIGSDLVTVGRDAIEATASVNVQEILKSVPSITAFGGSGQGQLPGVSYYSPTIHSLGSSASNSTLILVDGFRIPEDATIAHPLSDPSIIPTIALERVEVLAEGASATYGADAVAGVINFVTRKKYEGLEFDAQYGSGADYDTMTIGGLFGHAWESGSAMAAFGYSYASSVPYDYNARPYLQPNLTSLAAADGLPAGATNGQQFNCSQASIQPTGSSVIYTSATSGVTLPNNQASRDCDNNHGDFLPTEKRTTALVRMTQDIGSRITVSADLDFSYRDTFQRVGRGTLTATVFSTGPQANPFYVKPAGYTGTATSETIYWDANGLLGQGAATDNNAETWFQTADIEYRLTDNFRFTASTNIGQDSGITVSNGKLCSSCADLALNGTTNTGGNTTTPSIPGTPTVVTNLPLTTANALDLWSPNGSNKTAASVLAGLSQSISLQRAIEQNTQFRIGADGEVFDLPAGPLRVAFGGEATHFIVDTTTIAPANFGPSINASSAAYYPFSRSVRSAFAEFAVPLISPEMGVPLIHKLDIDLSGRYDSYSDFGTTKNPKVAISWEVMEGLKLRANWSTAFVAPSPRSEGLANADGLNSISSASLSTASAVIPVAAFPGIIGVPGCPAGSVTCTISSSVPGINRYTGDPNVKPETGRTWSVGADYTPEFLPDLNLSVTMFNNKIVGGITSPVFANIISNPSLYSKLQFCGAAGCTQTQINNFIGPAPITSALAPVTYYLYDRRQGNFLNSNLSGLDFTANYKFDTANWGTFLIGVSGTQFLTYQQNFAGGANFSVLNTTGYNVTYPSIAAQQRYDLGWRFDSIGFDLFLNYVGGYHDWSATTLIPVTTNPVTGVPTGGGDPVKSSVTLDTHLSYDLDRIGVEQLAGSQVYLDVRNLLDQAPEFINGTGYDPYGGNPLGRVISVGARAKF